WVSARTFSSRDVLVSHSLEDDGVSTHALPADIRSLEIPPECVRFVDAVSRPRRRDAFDAVCLACSNTFWKVGLLLARLSKLIPVLRGDDRCIDVFPPLNRGLPFF